MVPAAPAGRRPARALDPGRKDDLPTGVPSDVFGIAGSIPSGSGPQKRAYSLNLK